MSCPEINHRGREYTPPPPPEAKRPRLDLPSEKAAVEDQPPVYQSLASLRAPPPAGTPLLSAEFMREFHFGICPTFSEKQNKTTSVSTDLDYHPQYHELQVRNCLTTLLECARSFQLGDKLISILENMASILMKADPVLIEEQLRNLPVGKSCLMVGGIRLGNDYDKTPDHHTMLYEFTRKEGNEYTISLYNTGEGITEFHPYYLHDGKTFYQPFMQYDDVPIEKLGLGQDQGFVRQLIELQKRTSFLPAEEGEVAIEVECESIYNKLFGLLEEDHLVAPSQCFDDFVSTKIIQGSESHLIDVLLAYLRTQWDDKKSYKEDVKAPFKFVTLLAFYHQNRSLLESGTTQALSILSILRKGVRELFLTYAKLPPLRGTEHLRTTLEGLQHELERLHYTQQKCHPPYDLGFKIIGEAVGVAGEKRTVATSRQDAKASQSYRSRPNRQLITLLTLSPTPPTPQTFASELKELTKKCDRLDPSTTVALIEAYLERLPLTSQEFWNEIPPRSYRGLADEIFNLFQSYLSAYQTLGSNFMISYELTAYIFLACMEQVAHLSNPALNTRTARPFALNNPYNRKDLLIFSEKQQELFESLIECFPKTKWKCFYLEFSSHYEAYIRPNRLNTTALFLLEAIKSCKEDVKEKFQAALKKQIENPRLKSLTVGTIEQIVALTECQLFRGTSDAYIGYWRQMDYQVRTLLLDGPGLFKDHYCCCPVIEEAGPEVMEVEIYEPESARLNDQDGSVYSPGSHWEGYQGRLVGHPDLDYEEMIILALKGSPKEAPLCEEGHLLAKLSKMLSSHSNLIPSHCLDYFRSNFHELTKPAAQTFFLHSFFGMIELEDGLPLWPLEADLDNLPFILSVNTFLEQGISYFSEGSGANLSGLLFLIQIGRRIEEFSGYQLELNPFRLEILNQILARVDLSAEERSVVHLHRLMEYRHVGGNPEGEAGQAVAHSWLMAKFTPLPPTEQNILQLEEVRRWIPLVFESLWKSIASPNEFCNSLLSEFLKTPVEITSASLSIPSIECLLGKEVWHLELLAGLITPPKEHLIEANFRSFPANPAFVALFNFSSFTTSYQGGIYYFHDEKQRQFRCDEHSYVEYLLEGSWVRSLQHVVLDDSKSEVSKPELDSLHFLMQADHTVWKTEDGHILSLDKESFELRYSYDQELVSDRKGRIYLSPSQYKLGKLNLIEDPKGILVAQAGSDVELHFPRLQTLAGDPLIFRNGVWDADPRFSLATKQERGWLGYCPNYLLLKNPKTDQRKLIVPLRRMYEEGGGGPGLDIQDSRDIAAVGIKQRNSRHCLVFNVVDGEVRPAMSTPEGWLFLSYLYASQGEYETALLYLSYVNPMPPFSPQVDQIVKWFFTHKEPDADYQALLMRVGNFSPARLLFKEATRLKTSAVSARLREGLPVDPLVTLWHFGAKRKWSLPNTRVASRPSWQRPARVDLLDLVAKHLNVRKAPKSVYLALQSEVSSPWLEYMASSAFFWDTPAKIAHPTLRFSPSPDPLVQREQKALQTACHQGRELNEQRLRYREAVPTWRAELEEKAKETREQLQEFQREIEQLLSTLDADQGVAQWERLARSGKLIDPLTWDEFTLDLLTEAFLMGTSDKYSKINVHLNLTDIQKLDHLMQRYLMCSRFLQQIKQANAAATPHESAKILREGNAYETTHPNYRLFLYFEYKKHLRLRKDQVELFDHLSQGTSASGQLNMGKGKSSVIIPLLVLNFALDRKIPIVVFPAPQFRTSSARLSDTLYPCGGVQLYMLELERKEMTKEKLEEVASKIESMWESGFGIATTPNTLHNLRLELLVSLQRKRVDLIPLLQKINKILKTEGCAILDEVDKVLDPSIQVNVPMGDKVMISPVYAHLLHHLFSLCLPLFTLREGETGRFREIDEPFYRAVVLPHLLQKLPEYPAFHLTPDEYAEFTDYLQGREVPAFQEKLEARSEASESRLKTSCDLIAIAKEMLQKILPTTLSKSLGRHYGRPKPETKCQVIFYSAVDTPSPTEIGNIWEASAYHFQAALFGEITPYQIHSLGVALREAGSGYLRADRVRSIDETLEGKTFRRLTGLSFGDLSDPEALQRGARHANYDALLKLEIEMETVAAHVGDYPHLFQSHPEGLVDMFERVVALSGTLTKNNHTYHSSLNERVYLDTGAEGQVFDALMHRPFILHETPSPSVEAIASLIAQNPKRSRIRGFIDTCGLLKENTNLEVASCFLNTLPEIETVLFFNRRSSNESVPSTLMALKKGGQEPLILRSSDPEELELHAIDMRKTFIYFNEGNSRGADFSKPDDSIDWLSLDNKIQLPDLTQGVMRSRKFLEAWNPGEGQEIEFISLAGTFRPGITLNDIFQIGLENGARQKEREMLRVSLGPKLDAALERPLWEHLFQGTPEEALELYKEYQDCFFKETLRSPYLLFGKHRPLVPTLVELQERIESKKELSNKSRTTKKIVAEIQESLSSLQLASPHLPPETRKGLNLSGILGTEIALSLSVDVALELEHAFYTSLAPDVPMIERDWEPAEVSDGRFLQRLQTLPFHPFHDYYQMGLYRLSDVGKHIAEMTQETKFPYPYAPIMPSFILATSNFLRSPLGWTPQLNYAFDILILPVPDRGGRFGAGLTACLISPQEASRLKTYLTEHPNPSIRLLLTDGTPQVPVAPYTPKEEKDVAGLLRWVNFLNGKISYLIHPSRLRDLPWFMSEDPTLKMKFLRLILMREHNATERELFYRHAHLFPAQEDSSQFMCSARTKQHMEQQREVAVMTPDQVAALTFEQEAIISVVELLPPALVQYLSDDRLLPLLQPHQYGGITYAQLHKHPELIHGFSRRSFRGEALAAFTDEQFRQLNRLQIRSLTPACLDRLHLLSAGQRKELPQSLKAAWQERERAVSHSVSD